MLGKALKFSLEERVEEWISVPPQDLLSFSDNRDRALLRELSATMIL